MERRARSAGACTARRCSSCLYNPHALCVLITGPVGRWMRPWCASSSAAKAAQQSHFGSAALRRASRVTPNAPWLWTARRCCWAPRRWRRPGLPRARRLVTCCCKVRARAVGKLVRGTGRGMPLPVRKAFYIGRQSPDFLRPKLDYCRPKQFYCRPRPAAQMLPISPGEVCVNDVDTCVLIPWLGVLTNKHSPPFRGWWRRALRVGACAVGGQTAGFKRRPRG